MQPTLTDAEFAKIGNITANGVTSSSGGRQQYSDNQGNTYYRNELNIGTPKYSTNYERVAGTPATIVTSGQSRTNYNNNVNTLQTAQNNLRTVQQGQTASGIAASLGMSPEQFLKLNPNFAATGGKGDFAGLSGAIKPGQTYKIGPDGTPQEVKITDTTKDDGTTVKTTTKYSDQLNHDPKEITNTIDNKDGTFTVAYKDGSTQVINEAPSKEVDQNGKPIEKKNDSTSVFDPIIQKQYDDALKNADDVITSAKETLDQAKATLANDPAALAAVEAIKTKYDVLIKNMQEKNSILLGGYKTSSIRSGGLQYANEMTSDFMSMEMDKANQRIGDLVAQEQSLILKAEQAYKTGDLKALDQATKAYENANKSKIDAINNLLKATNDAVKSAETQKKADLAASKQQITDDIRISNSLGKVVADTITSSGITDETKIDEYISAMAEKSGIVNVDILKSSVLKAQEASQKAALGIENTKSIIKKRGQTGTSGSTSTAKGGGKDGGYAYSGDDVTKYTEFLNKGGAAPDGTVYAGRGKDTYVDPGAYTAVYEDWVANGGTPQGFLKKFPIKNVNPDGRDQLPAGLTAKK